MRRWRSFFRSSSVGGRSRSLGLGRGDFRTIGVHEIGRAPEVLVEIQRMRGLLVLLRNRQLREGLPVQQRSVAPPARLAQLLDQVLLGLAEALVVDLAVQ